MFAHPLRTTLSFAALLSFACAQAAEPSWPQFRGPGGLGVADPSNPPVHFGPAENVLWKVPMTPGHSSPCVWGDRIFLTTFHDGALETLCLNRTDGSTVWRQP